MQLRDFEISTDPKRLDVEMLHQFLSTSYWAQGRSREVVARSISNSICFGAYEQDRQIGFARVISDLAVFAYLADVFVLPEYRGRGVAKAIVRAVIAHPELQHLRVFLLRTRDAHELYRQFGFDTLQAPGEMMARYSP